MFAKGKVIACVGHTLDKLGRKSAKHTNVQCALLSASSQGVPNARQLSAMQSN